MGEPRKVHDCVMQSRDCVNSKIAWNIIYICDAEVCELATMHSLSQSGRPGVPVILLLLQ